MIRRTPTMLTSVSKPCAIDLEKAASMNRDLQLRADETLVSVERYPGRPTYQVVTQQRSFDVPSLTELLPIITASAGRPSPLPVRESASTNTP